jgi:hypothetical protein
MATYTQLDQAAKEVGKSEVTLRRLVKAGKISHRKEKTLTGFIYLVDPKEVLRHYHAEGGETEAGETDAEPQTNTSHDAQPARQIRLAVTGESGNLSEYWQKRAETYEERYYQELENEGKLREELGVWRGRAEQAQNMLVKLLPAPESQTPAAPVKEEATMPFWMVAAVMGVSVVVVGAGILAAYLIFSR